jgi:transcription elongation GreA/GreB family factor
MIELYNNTPSKITELTRQGKLPVLPFEYAELIRQLLGFGADQDTLGQLLTQAMHQGAETFHDNAPAEAVNAASRVLSKRAKSTIALMCKMALVDYPQRRGSRMTLGSIATVSYGNSSDTQALLLAGYRSGLPVLKEETELPQPDALVTVSSPVGQALLDGVAGKRYGYSVEGRGLSIVVHDIHQLADDDLTVSYRLEKLTLELPALASIDRADSRFPSING